MQIHVRGPDERRPQPELIDKVHDDDDRSSKICLEEALYERASRHFRISDGGEAGPELGDEDQAIKDEAAPGADDARLGAEGQLIDGVACHAPGLAEADVREADGAPG